ncbi:hypothetical protein F2P81_017096, partial [Scophthalmus maximus]
MLRTGSHRIQRAWRARMSRRGSWQGQDESLTSHHQGETVPSESQQQDPGMTTDISPECDYRHEVFAQIYCIFDNISLTEKITTHYQHIVIKKR